MNQLLALTTGVCVVVGVAVAAFFIRRGPTLETPPRALTWARGEPDAGAREIDATWFGVELVRLRDVDEPVLEAGALHRGDEWLVLDGLNCFEQFMPVDGGVYVLGEWCTEGGSTSAELLFLSSDGGATHLASLPKPAYFATIRGLTVERDTLRISIEQDVEEPVALPDEWVLPPFRVEPLTRVRPTAGQLVIITSKNRGLSWRLDRFPATP